MKNLNRNLILIDCPDEKGLVFKISNVLYQAGLNIESNLEFVEKSQRHFFMRTETSGGFDQKEITEALKSKLPESAQIRFANGEKKKILLFVTKEYHCLGDLIGRHHFGDLGADILAVISNREVLRDYTERFDLPFHFISSDDISREAHEAEVLKVIRQYNFDYLVLAKYMRILNPAFVAHFPQRIINIHHSFLPAFIGANPYRQAYERGVKIIGATAHFVTDNLDEGPIIAQDIIPVDHSYSVKEMAAAGKNVEKNVLAKALKLVFEERCFVFGNRTVVLT